MNYSISNGLVTIEVSTLGAELQSIKDNGGHEYLWQGDINSWKNRAINIFPWVARLTGGKYTYGGKEYSMKNHGFASASEFNCEKQENQLVFTLESSPETLLQYPFNFKLEIIYTLEGRSIIQSYKVTNKDDKTMYFGLGGHPGFIVPMEEGKAFSDYKLVFSEKAVPQRVGMSPDCYVTDDDKDFLLENGDTIPLSQELFVNDAIILKGMAPSVTLCSQGGRSLRVDYDGFDYLGIWNWPTKDVDYVCVEPWTSLPARKDKVEALEEKPELVSLKQGNQAVYSFTITI